MPALDKIHSAVKNALIKDGWTITNDPYILEYQTDRFYADLRAEQTINEANARRVIVVEIKSMLGLSLMREMEVALGQYQVYRSILQVTAPDCQVYLAVRDTAYTELKARPTFELIRQTYQVALIVVNTDREEIMQWII